MTSSHNSLCAAFGSLMILSAVSGVAVVSNTFVESASAASKNFAGQCQDLNGNVKGLAIEPNYSEQQICACAKSNPEFRQQLGVTGIKCFDNKITNFNQATSTPGSSTNPDPTDDPALSGNNGWGNGGEGINNGSDNGSLAQATSKSSDDKGKGDR